MLLGPHKGFTLLINGYDIFYICYANYKSNIYLDERFMLCIYDCKNFYFPYKKYKSHRTLCKVFMIRIYDQDTFYDPYNNYDIFYVPYKKDKSHRTLYKVFTLRIYDYDLSKFLITTTILFTFLIKCIRATKLCKTITPHIYNYDIFYIPCKKYKSQVIVPS